MIEWVKAISPATIVGLVFFFVIGRIHKQIDNKVNAKECGIMHKELEKDIREIKEINGKVFNKIEENRIEQAEMRESIKWIREHLKKNSK